jgi:HAMP domain-containing protein
MLKSLSAKAIVPVALAVTGFVVVCCILLYSVMKTDMTNDATIQATNLANTIVKSTRYAMLKSDRETLSNIIDNIGEQHGVETVRIFNKKGLIMVSKDHPEVGQFVDKKTAGCIGCHAGAVPKATFRAMELARTFTNARGSTVLAITAPVYNEPECFNAACHFHPPEQKVLGTLDIGLDQAPLIHALGVMRNRMIIFSLMILVLTVGGVAALLRRNVFMPIKSLSDFTNQAVRGTIVQHFPRCGGEIEEIASNVRTIAEELNKAKTELDKR